MSLTSYLSITLTLALNIIIKFNLILIAIISLVPKKQGQFSTLSIPNLNPDTCTLILTLSIEMKV